MNHNQLFVINSALDGEDIYGLRTFKGTKMSIIQRDQIKQELIRIGVLEDLESFTINGTKYVKQIYDYKKAIKYIHFNNMIIAPISNDIAIAMKQKDGIYGFRRVSTKDIYDQFSKVYSFLELETVESGEVIEKASLKDLFMTYKIKKHNSFVIRTISPADSIETIELFFECDKKCFIFEPKVKRLAKISSEEQKKRLLERMRIHV